MLTPPLPLRTPSAGMHINDWARGFILPDYAQWLKYKGTLIMTIWYREPGIDSPAAAAGLPK